MYVIYCLILTAWQWLMSFTCIPAKLNPIKAHWGIGSWPFSFERSATFPPQADHVLVDLFSSVTDGDALQSEPPLPPLINSRYPDRIGSLHQQVKGRAMGCWMMLRPHEKIVCSPTLLSPSYLDPSAPNYLILDAIMFTHLIINSFRLLLGTDNCGRAYWLWTLIVFSPSSCISGLSKFGLTHGQLPLPMWLSSGHWDVSGNDIYNFWDIYIYIYISPLKGSCLPSMTTLPHFLFPVGWVDDTEVLPQLLPCRWEQHPRKWRNNRSEKSWISRQLRGGRTSSFFWTFW